MPKEDDPSTSPVEEVEYLGNRGSSKGYVEETV